MANYKSRHTPTTQEVLITSEFTTTSTSYVIVTALTVTIPTRTNGKTLIIAQFSMDNNTTTDIVYAALHDDTVIMEGAQMSIGTANHSNPTTLMSYQTSDGSAIALYIKVNANTGTVNYQNNNTEPKLTTVEF